MTDLPREALRVLVVAADRLARAGLAAVLEAAEMQVVGTRGLEAIATRSEVLRGTGVLHEAGVLGGAEVAVIDWGWTEDAADAAETLTDVLPCLSLVADTDAAPLAWSAGATGVLLRDAGPRALTAAVAAVAAGLRVGDAESLSRPVGRTDQLTEPLTPREEDVLALLAEGLSNRQIGSRLAISENTVKFHVNALLTKLNAESRTEAAIRAARLGLVRI